MTVIRMGRAGKNEMKEAVMLYRQVFANLWIYNSLTLQKEGEIPYV